MAREWTITVGAVAQTAPGAQQEVTVVFPWQMAEGYAVHDSSHGQYLCETCFDVMTNGVLPKEQTTTGLDEACCAACWPKDVPTVGADPLVYYDGSHWQSTALPLPETRPFTQEDLQEAEQRLAAAREAVLGWGMPAPVPMCGYCLRHHETRNVCYERSEAIRASARELLAHRSDWTERDRRILEDFAIRGAVSW